MGLGWGGEGKIETQGETQKKGRRGTSEERQKGESRKSNTVSRAGRRKRECREKHSRWEEVRARQKGRRRSGRGQSRERLTLRTHSTHTRDGVKLLVQKREIPFGG